LGAVIAQIYRQTSTAGIEFMDPALDAVIVALRSIRDEDDSFWKRSNSRDEKGALHGSGIKDRSVT
jgi:hypothetical protein